jgi:hypothetical protein
LKIFYRYRKCRARFGEQGVETRNMTPLQWCAAQNREAVAAPKTGELS